MGMRSVSNIFCNVWLLYIWAAVEIGNCKGNLLLMSLKGTGVISHCMSMRSKKMRTAYFNVSSTNILWCARYLCLSFSQGWTVLEIIFMKQVYCLLRPFSLGWTKDTILLLLKLRSYQYQRTMLLWLCDNHTYRLTITIPVFKTFIFHRTHVILTTLILYQMIYLHLLGMQ